MLFGFDISSMSAIILSTQYRDFFNEPSGVTQGAIGSALAAGSIIGSLIAGPISNKIGRRDSIMFAALWWLAGTSVQVATNGIASLIVGRILNGVCVGITSSQVPVYLGEIARKEKRGSLIIIQQLAIGKLKMLTLRIATFTNTSRRMGYLDHVLHRLRLYLYRRSCLIQNGMGHSVCSNPFLPISC